MASKIQEKSSVCNYVLSITNSIIIITNDNFSFSVLYGGIGQQTHVFLPAGFQNLHYGDKQLSSLLKSKKPKPTFFFFGFLVEKHS